MSAWWSNDHPRLEAERGGIAALAGQSDWFENSEWSFDDAFRVQVVFEIRLEYGVFPLRLIYHNTFPNTAPSVRPVDPTRLSDHQYGNGDLCLEIRPDNWTPEFTGADMIESAFNLLTKERPDEDGNAVAAPSAHNVPESIETRNAVSRFYLSPAQLSTLLHEAPAIAFGKLWQQWCSEGFIVAQLSEMSQGDWSWQDTALPPTLGKDVAVQPVIVVKAEKSERTLRGIAHKDLLFDVLGMDLSLDQPAFSCLVCPVEGLPVLFQQMEGAEGLIKYRTILAPQETMSRGGDIRERLAGTRIGIVGLGSIGSKIAVSLARAGVGRFDLIDDDIIHVGNLDRHDADWRDIGLHKVDSVARRIGLVSSNVEVSARRVAIGAQVSTTEMATVDGALNECDLIIDATADPEVLNHLTAISLRAANALQWGGVFAGGIGGYMARSRPECEPSPHLIRQALNEFYDSIVEKPPVAVGRRYDGQSHDEVFIASDADVTLLASHMTQFALDALLRNEPSEFDTPLYLIGFRRAWVFDSAFYVQPITVDAPVRPQSGAAAKIEDQENFVGDLVKKKLDEIKNRSKDN